LCSTPEHKRCSTYVTNFPLLENDSHAHQLHKKTVGSPGIKQFFLYINSWAVSYTDLGGGLWQVPAISLQIVSFALAAALSAAGAIGDWKRIEWKSELTDDVRLMWMLKSSNPPEAFPNTPRSIFGISCQNTVVGVMFSVPEFVGFGRKSIRYRIDGGDVLKTNIHMSEDGRTGTLWKGDAMKFLQRVSSAKKLVIGFGTIEASFLLHGIAAVLSETSEDCPSLNSGAK